jgi:tRNA pseudouridine38-40 synthase
LKEELPPFPTRRIRLDFEYLGSNYAGWQWQDNALSIQQVAEKALEKIAGHHARINASGRTDAGVHAENQPAHADVATKMSDETIMRGVNSILPKDIVVTALTTVDPSWHSRFDAVEKTYRYTILNRRTPSVFLHGRVWLVYSPLDMDAMRKAAEALLGEHDFSSFRAARCAAKNPVRTLTELTIVRDGDIVIFTLTSSGFLKQMVRNIVGTLAEVGRGRMEPDAVAQILAVRDRTKAGPCAPPEGLTLVRVRY